MSGRAPWPPNETVKVTPADNRPSIAELQRQHREGTGLQLLDAEGVLLEIAAAALELRAQMTVAAKCRAVIHQNHYAGDAAYVAVDTADTELARCQSVYDAALAKVRP